MQQCILGSPHSSSSELSPQSSTLLQTCWERRQTRSFLQRNGRVGGQGCFAAGRGTKAGEAPWSGSRAPTGEDGAWNISIVCLVWTPQPYHTCLRAHRSCRHSRPCRRRPTCAVCIRCCCRRTRRPGRRKHLRSQREKSCCQIKNVFKDL